MNCYRGIFLDTDETLYPLKHCNELGEKTLLSFLSVRLQKPLKEIIEHFDAAKRIVDQQLGLAVSLHSRLLYIKECTERIIGNTDVLLIHEAHELFLRSFFRGMELRKGARSFLQRAKREYVQIIVVSDCRADAELKRIIALGFRFTDLLVTSEEAGSDTLDARVFALALKKSGLKPEQVVMIGSDYEKDIVGAQAAGIKTCYLLTVSENQELNMHDSTIRVAYSFEEISQDLFG